MSVESSIDVPSSRIHQVQGQIVKRTALKTLVQQLHSSGVASLTRCILTPARVRLQVLVAETEPRLGLSGALGRPVPGVKTTKLTGAFRFRMSAAPGYNARRRRSSASGTTTEYELVVQMRCGRNEVGAVSVQARRRASLP
ncbi:uncharacterized protein LOC125945313 [Dermacentor silvarum]|uniref:uncharacterized protein LOC125945313 n=1 Tax=Dermacentor silvarum TaxID=543639 RepID=UPI0021007989|nr:uncharacterized protein LOC125945313 [Dermacentor silvarum]